jgi:hypothetical protein
MQCKRSGVAVGAVLLMAVMAVAQSETAKKSAGGGASQSEEAAKPQTRSVDFTHCDEPVKSLGHAYRVKYIISEFAGETLVESHVLVENELDDSGGLGQLRFYSREKNGIQVVDIDAKYCNRTEVTTPVSPLTLIGLKITANISFHTMEEESARTERLRKGAFKSEAEAHEAEKTKDLWSMTYRGYGTHSLGKRNFLFSTEGSDVSKNGTAEAGRHYELEVVVTESR